MKKFDVKKILIILAVVLCYFSSDYIVSYSTDTYSYISSGFKNVANFVTFNNGRPIMGLFYYLLNLLNVNFEIQYKITYFLAIVFLTVSVYLLFEELQQIIENQTICVIVAIAAIINVFIIEFFCFFEKGLFTFGIFLVIVAVKMFNLYQNFNSIKHLLISLLLLTLCSFDYQALPALFICITSIFIIKYNKTFFNYIKYTLISCALWSLSVIFNYVFVVLFTNSSRTSLSNSIIEGILDVIGHIRIELINTFLIVPKYSFLLLLMFYFLILLIVSLKNRNINLILEFLISIVIVVFASTSSLIVSSGWWCPRIIYPIGSVMDLGFVVSYTNINKVNFKQLLIIPLLVMLTLQLFGFQRIISDRHKVNSLDYFRIKEIENEILRYELENKTEIKRISIYWNSDDITNYDNLLFSGDLVLSSFSRGWSNVNAINHYLKRNLEKIENEEKFLNMYLDYTNEYSQKCIFEDETLHLFIY